MLGTEIRRRRKELGWSQEKLGELTDMTQKQISKIETQGTHDVRKLKRLAAAFGMAVDELIEHQVDSEKTVNDEESLAGKKHTYLI